MRRRLPRRFPFHYPPIQDDDKEVLDFRGRSEDKEFLYLFVPDEASLRKLPATFAVIAMSLDRSRHTMGVGVQSMIRRAPMMVGPLIGGWLITRYGWEQGVSRCSAASA